MSRQIYWNRTFGWKMPDSSWTISIHLAENISFMKTLGTTVFFFPFTFLQECHVSYSLGKIPLPQCSHLFIFHSAVQSCAPVGRIRWLSQAQSLHLWGCLCVHGHAVPTESGTTAPHTKLYCYLLLCLIYSVWIEIPQEQELPLSFPAPYMIQNCRLIDKHGGFSNEWD